MRTTFQSKPEDKACQTIRISEFSFESYPVSVKHGIRRSPDTKSFYFNPRKQWLHRILQTLTRAVRQSADRLQIVENGSQASAWTARALAARVFIGFKHPQSSWVTDRLPVALWPEMLKREIQQAGFAKLAESKTQAA